MSHLQVLENMQSMDRFIDGSRTSESTTSSEGNPELAKHSGSLEASTASSEHDAENSEHSQPECEPDFEISRSEIARQVTEEVCWSTWSDNSWHGQAVLESYPMHSLAVVAAPLGNEQVEGNVSAQLYSVSKEERDSYARNMANYYRREHESLIDQAARKQNLHSRRSTQEAQYQEAQYQRRQAASSTHSNMGTRKHASRTHVAKFCPSCGGVCQADFKFCRFCGSKLPVHA
jgi:hypothetical protein